MDVLSWDNEELARFIAYQGWMLDIDDGCVVLDAKYTGRPRIRASRPLQDEPIRTAILDLVVSMLEFLEKEEIITDENAWTFRNTQVLVGV